MNHDQEQKRTAMPQSETGTSAPPDRQRGQSGEVSAFEPGDMIAARYKVLSLVGRGAIGSVYAVEQVFMKKRFALKTLNASVASTVSQRRLQKESQAASMLEHENLVRAVDFGIADDGRPFLVMDFVEGQTLCQHLKEVGRLSPEEALRIFIPVCFGMGYAHDQGVIHRDIKPSNIVLESGDGGTLVPKIVDFGIAKFAEDAEAEALTRTGEVFGTPWYMSPEQCAGIKVDNRSDIYALGCVLYESLTGAPPFCGQTALETMMQHRTEPVPPLAETSLGLSFPPALERIVQKMLAKEPDDRYQSCSKLAEDLILAQRGEAVVASSNIPSSTAKVASKRLPPSRLYLYLLLIPAIASIAILMYTLRSQQQKLAASQQIPTPDYALPNDRPEQVAAFCQGGDWLHGRTFYFGDRPTDPTYTFGSAISYSDSSRKHDDQETVARGHIAVPPRSDLEFQPSLTFMDHPTLFGGFKPGDIQKLSLVSSNILTIPPGPFNAALAWAEGLKDLKDLECKYVPLNSEGLTHLKLDSMPSLTQLCMIDTLVDGNDLGHLTVLRQLYSLEFSSGKNASALLETLKRLWHTSTTGHHLSLHSDNLTDDDLSMIGELDLDYVNIRDNPALTNAGLRHLFKQKRLNLIQLDGDQFDRSAIQLLASKIHLNYLLVGCKGWTDEKKGQFRRSLAPCSVEFEDARKQD